MRPTIILTIVLASASFASRSYADGLPSFDDLVKLGRSAYLASDLNGAESAYNRACPADSVGAFPVAQLITCENVLASIDEARGILARAEQRHLHAVAVADQAGSAYRPLYCARLIDLGEYYRRQEETEKAEANLRKAVEVARQLARSGDARQERAPLTDDQPQLLPEALIRLGGLYSRSAQPETGREPIEEALRLIAAQDGPAKVVPAVEIAYAHNVLGFIDLAAGREREAEASLRESVAIAIATLGEDHPVTAAYQTNLASALIVSRRFADAIVLLRRADFVVESRPNPSASELAVILAELSAATAGDGKAAHAEQFARRAIALFRTQARPNAQAVAIAQLTLAGAYLGGHDLAAAEDELVPAVVALRRLPVNPVILADAIQMLGRLRELQHNWMAAESLYREALAGYRTDGRTATRDVVPLLRALANVLTHTGNSKDEIRALKEEARNILRETEHASPRA